MGRTKPLVAAVAGLLLSMVVSAGGAQAEVSGNVVGWGSDAYGMATPPPGTGYAAIAAGGVHSLALWSDGSIVGWGYDDSGQATPPAGTGYTAIAAGRFHSLALRSDGSIVGWGSDDSGQATPPAGTGYTAIAAGDFHGLALRADGSIVGWGSDDSGQATPPAGTGYTAIAAGDFHGLALRADGSIAGWGYDVFGQATPPAGTGYVAIAAGGAHSLALRSDGSIVGWGKDYAGQATPPAGTGYTAIAAGGHHSLALRADGSIAGWGYDVFGQATPPAGTGYVAIAAGGQYAGAFGSHSLAATAALPGPQPDTGSDIVGWGNNTDGQSGPWYGYDHVAIAAGGRHSLALHDDGSMIGRGSNGYGQATPPAGTDYVAIAAGGYHSLALKSDGSIVGWGKDSDGQATSPAGTDYVAIAASGSHSQAHSLALKSDGSIVQWGFIDSGSPPPAGAGYVAIAAGQYHSLALKSDGSIVGWGSNWSGQSTAPPGTDYVAIAAGGDQSLALKGDGSIVGWGSTATPPAGTDYVAIDAGASHSLALKSDGSIVGWGSNGYGEATPPYGNNLIAISAGGEYSLALTAVAPGAPIDVTAVAGKGEATVSWVAPVSDGGAPITGYTVTAAPGGQTCSTTSALSCRVTGLPNGEPCTFTVTATNVAGTGPASVASAEVTPSALLMPVTPYRFVDTRQSGVKVGAADGNGPPLVVDVTGSGGVPASGVDAVSLNVTVDQGELPNIGGGYVTVYACNTGRPNASNLNFGAGQTVPNAVVTPVSPAGEICVYVYGTAHILVDVNGYYPTGSDFGTVTPYRFVDTRQGGMKVGAADGNGAPLVVDVTGSGGVPASGVDAVSLNVTVDQGELPNIGGGYVTVYACNTGRPNASNLNFGAGQTVPNAVITPVSPSGEICVYVYGTAHILVDVNGYYPTGSDFGTVTPYRFVDTRQSGVKVGAADGNGPPLVVDVTGSGGVPASGVDAGSLNVTVDQGELPDIGGGYVTVYACNTGRPNASNLNFGQGQTVPNAVVTPVSPAGEICVYVYGTAHILVDVNGYYPT